MYSKTLSYKKAANKEVSPLQGALLYNDSTLLLKASNLDTVLNVNH